MPHRYATRRTLVRGRAVAGGGGVGVAPTLDGAGGAGGGIGTAIASSSFATSNTNDILVAFVFHDVLTGAAGPATMGSPTDNLGVHLTWARRGSQASFHSDGPGTPWCAIDVFWALSAITQTAVAFSCTATAQTPDNWAVIVKAVSGCGNTAAPWDVNGALPRSISDLTAGLGIISIPTVTGIATTAPGTLMLMAAGNANSAGSPTTQGTGAGFTLVTNQTSSGGTHFSAGALQTGPFTTAQSGLTGAFTQNWNSWIALVDALVGT